MEKKILFDFFLLKKLFLQKIKKVYVSFEKFFYPENTYSFCEKNFLIIKIYLLKLRGELNNLVLKVSEARNM